jgi:tetratricopeptide (TPR) repeat protein
MTLAEERLKQPDDTSLTTSERIRVRCRVAAEFIQSGQYEAARDALGELWPGLGRHPEVARLPPEDGAEVLLQCGVLTGWLGSAQSVPGIQEQAKDLLSEALRKFQSQGQFNKVSEVQYELGMCYWRLGSFDEARVVMREALLPLKNTDVELKAKIFIRRTVVEIWENRYYEALTILRKAEPVFDSVNDALKGRWHGQMGLVLIRLANVEGYYDYADTLSKLANVEGNNDYADRAIIEFTAAIYHYKQAGHERYCAANLNNLAMTLHKLGRYAEAHEPLDRAQWIFIKLKDTGNLAHVDETRARVLVAERKYREANRIITGVVQTLDKSGELALLADALTVQGVIYARLGLNDNSISTLRRAMIVAEESGAITSAGLAGLTLIEEHGHRLPFDAMRAIYKQSDEFLSSSPDREDLLRLRACARRIATTDNSSIINSLIMEAKENEPFHSCFISYNHKDQEFVERLYSRLKDARVPVWFDAKDVKGGRKLHEQIVKQIREHDKLLIILSKNSLRSDWVKTEICEALKGRGRRKRAKLFPIRLVSMDVIDKWECFDADSGKDLAREVRQYPVGDFSNWRNHGSFEASADRLIKDLQKKAVLLKLAQQEDLFMEKNRPNSIYPFKNRITKAKPPDTGR